MNEILNNLGLGEKEKLIYGLILEYGRISPALLSRLSKVNRTTVYSVTKELINKNFVTEDTTGKNIFYTPANIQKIGNIIQSKQKETSLFIGGLKELQDLIGSLPDPKKYCLPKIRFVEEENIETFLYEETKKWYDSMLKTEPVFWGFQDVSFVENFEKWIDWSWKKAPKEIILRMLTNESKIEQKMQSKKYRTQRVLKFFTSSNFTMSQWVMGDYMVFVNTKQNPFYLIQIEDAVLAQNTREVFKALWGKTF